MESSGQPTTIDEANQRYVDSLYGDGAPEGDLEVLHRKLNVLDANDVTSLEAFDARMLRPLLQLCFTVQHLCQNLEVLNMKLNQPSTNFFLLHFSVKISLPFYSSID